MLMDWRASGGIGSDQVHESRGYDRGAPTGLQRDRSRRNGTLIGGLPRKPAAVIYRPCRSVMTSGKAQSSDWVLRFERVRPLFTDPLMGWTGDDDPLAKVELRFPELQSAIDYAERQGLTYTVISLGTEVNGRAEDRADRDALEETSRCYLTLAWLQAQSGSCELPPLPHLDRALINPAAVFASPDEVVDHQLLTAGCKRRILNQWAWDEYLIELASDEAMPENAPSRLAEVKAALARLYAADASTLVFVQDNRFRWGGPKISN